jgi:hypothetical protein
MAELIYKDEVYAIVGAAMEVYNQLGIDTLTSREESQLINYLKATGLKVGLLINFGSYGKLEWRRLVLTKDGSNRRPPRYLREDETQYSIRED